MNSAQVRKIIKKYMVPFFEQYGYKLVTSKNQGYLFENIENLDLKIVYEFQRVYNGPYEVNVMIKRDNEGVWPYLDLTCFLNDISFPDPTFLNGNWYFDTEEELIGALEEQAHLFLEKAFEWLKSNEVLDVGKVADDRAEERATISQTGTQEERERLFQIIQSTSEVWRERRISPKLWENGYSSL